MDKPEHAAIICFRRSFLPHPSFPGEVVLTQCSKCGEDVWASPRLMFHCYQEHGDFDTVCFECAAPMILSDDTQVNPLGPVSEYNLEELCRLTGLDKESARSMMARAEEALFKMAVKSVRDQTG